MQSESKFKANLLKIRSLRDGWLEGEGKAPSKELLDWFESWFFDFYKENFPGLEYPSLFAVFDGGLLLEWFLPGLQPSLDISPEKTGWLHAIVPDSELGYVEIDFDFSDPNDNLWVDLLRKFLNQPL
jgi:hypothetical protein